MISVKKYGAHDSACPEIVNLKNMVSNESDENKFLMNVFDLITIGEI